MKFEIFRTEQHDLLRRGKSSSLFLAGDNKHKKCLPFRLVGELGWDVCLPHDYTVHWNGGARRSDIQITSGGASGFVTSEMGNGILSLKIPYLFELEPGNFLWIKGANNNPLSMDLYACEGLVESDWFPGDITMNYKCLAAGKTIELKAGAPYCRLVPYPKNYIEKFAPEYREMQNSPQFYSKYSEYIFASKFASGFRTFSNYFKGLIGNKKMDNFLKIVLNAPQSPKKCPFHNLH